MTNTLLIMISLFLFRIVFYMNKKAYFLKKNSECALVAKMDCDSSNTINNIIHECVT